jgi:hypothetical protein
MLARYTRVQRDKLLAPQFFCWPGKCLTTYRQPIDASLASALFEEHSALFINEKDLDIYPRSMPGRSEAAVQRLFDNFYVWISTYEMTRQWIIEDGAFEYDYNWLTSKFSREEVKAWVDVNFEHVYKTFPDDFAVLR